MKIIEWSTKPITIRVAILIYRASVSMDPSAVVELLVLRAEGQLTEKDILDLPLTGQEYGQLVSDCLAVLNSIMDTAKDNQKESFRKMFGF